MIFLDLDDLLVVGERALGAPVEVRDHGLLESALARPQATVFGEDAYPDLATKAAALLHSIVRNHALVDGNKRLALGATVAFLGLNGFSWRMDNDEQFAFMLAVARSELDDVADIAAVLQQTLVLRSAADPATD